MKQADPLTLTCNDIAANSVSLQLTNKQKGSSYLAIRCILSTILLAKVKYYISLSL